MAAKKRGVGDSIADHAHSKGRSTEAKLRLRQNRELSTSEKDIKRSRAELLKVTEKIAKQEEFLATARKKENVELPKNTKLIREQIKARKEQLTALREVTKDMIQQTKWARELTQKNIEHMKQEFTARGRAQRSAEAYRDATGKMTESVQELGKELTWQNLALRAAGNAWYQAKRGMMGAMQTLREMPRTAADAHTAMAQIERDMVGVAADTHTLANTYHVNYQELGKAQDAFLARFNRSRGDMRRTMREATREALELQTTVGYSVEEGLDIQQQMMMAGRTQSQVGAQLRTMRYIADEMRKTPDRTSGVEGAADYFYNDRSLLTRTAVTIALNTKNQRHDLARMTGLLAVTGRRLAELGETQTEALEASQALVSHFTETQNAPDVIKYLTGHALGAQMRGSLRDIESNTRDGSEERRTRMTAFQQQYGTGDTPMTEEELGQVRGYHGGYGESRRIFSRYGGSQAGIQNTQRQYGAWARQAGPEARGSVLGELIHGLTDGQQEDIAQALAESGGSAAESANIQELIATSQRNAAAGAAGGGTATLAYWQNFAEHGLADNLSRMLDNNFTLTGILAAVSALAGVIPGFVAATRVAPKAAAEAAKTAGQTATTAAETAGGVARGADAVGDAATTARAAEEIAAHATPAAEGFLGRGIGAIRGVGSRIAGSGIGRAASGLATRIGSSTVGRGAAGLGRGLGAIGKAAGPLGSLYSAYQATQSYREDEDIMDNHNYGFDVLGMATGLAGGVGVAGTLAGEGMRYFLNSADQDIENQRRSEVSAMDVAARTHRGRGTRRGGAPTPNATAPTAVRPGNAPVPVPLPPGVAQQLANQSRSGAGVRGTGPGGTVQVASLSGDAQRQQNGSLTLAFGQLTINGFDAAVSGANTNNSMLTRVGV